MLARVLTGAALIAALLAALFLLQRPAFAALVGAIVAIAGFEWGRLTGLARNGAAGYGAALAAVFALLAWWDAALQQILWLAVFFWLALVPWWLSRAARVRGALLLRAAGLMVILPAALSMLALSAPRLLLLLGLVWTADTAAYLAGRAFGRRKLAPSISPGKSWEGVAGAGAACVIYAIICAMLDPELASLVRAAGWAPYLGGAALLCAASIGGDLLESALKRQAGAKDSGTLLPGHGGVLDRIDSATATLPLGALLMHWTGTT